MDGELSLQEEIKKNIETFIQRGLLEEAFELIKVYESINSVDAIIYAMKAIIKIFQNKLDEADIILNDAIQIYPEDSTLLFNKAYLRDKQNRYNEAIELYCLGKLLNPYSEVELKDIISELKPIDWKNLNVLQGTMEIANQMKNITESLKKMGVNATTINYYPSYLGYKSDIEFDVNAISDWNKVNIETKRIAAKQIAENDIFHFHFGTSLTFDHLDLLLIKELGKKVIMQYWGSEVRTYSKAKEINPYIKLKDNDEKLIRKELELVSENIKSCIVDYELAEYVKGYYEDIHYSKVSIDLKKYKVKNIKNNKKILIVHAPTSPEVKGTKYILEAIKGLKNNYEFDFKLVEKMPHEDAIKIYEEADLIIDQILIGSHGVFAVEAMALGKPVICWISDFMKSKYPKELPIISANPDNVKEKIEYFLLNRELLQEYGQKGRKYVEKYHDVDKIAKNIMDIYRNI